MFIVVLHIIFYTQEFVWLIRIRQNKEEDHSVNILVSGGISSSSSEVQMVKYQSSELCTGNLLSANLNQRDGISILFFDINSGHNNPFD